MYCLTFQHSFSNFCKCLHILCLVSTCMLFAGPCLAGNYMTDSGCQQCGENTFSAAGASSCTNCLEHMISAAGSTSEDNCIFGKNDRI